MIPEDIKNALDWYAERHEAPGGFLLAVLNNDLERAIAMANPDNREAFVEIVDYCRAEIPAQCWGSPGAVLRWVNMVPEPEEPVR